MGERPLEGSENVSVGGYQAIKKVRGLLVDFAKERAPESWENGGDLVVLYLEDAEILEMFNNEEPFELPDRKFNWNYPYKLTQNGKVAPFSVYNKCCLESAKEVFGSPAPSQAIGQVVTIEKQPRVLFQNYVAESDLKANTRPILDADGNKVVNKDGKIKVTIIATSENGLPNRFCFVKDEGADNDSVKDRVKEALVGLNEKAALRKLVIDFKSYPEFKDAYNKGTITDLLGLVVVDGKYEAKVG